MITQLVRRQETFSLYYHKMRQLVLFHNHEKDALQTQALRDRMRQFFSSAPVSPSPFLQEQNPLTKQQTPQGGGDAWCPRVRDTGCFLREPLGLAEAAKWQSVCKEAFHFQRTLMMNHSKKEI